MESAKSSGAGGGWNSPLWDFVLIDETGPCQETGTGSWLLADFPRKLLPLPEAAIQPLIGQKLCGQAATGTLLSTFLTRVAQDARTYRTDDAVRLSGILLDLTAAMLTHHLEADQPPPAGAFDRALFEQIQVFIQQRIGDPALTPETIAAAHHISTRTLHRLFHTHSRTVAATIRDHRLDRCRRDLADPLLRHLPIHAVANRRGFTNASHFTRAFQAAYGISPREYRGQFDHHSTR